MLCVPEEQINMEDLDAKKIKMCKVQWSHHTKEEATWEREEELKVEFPGFFSIRQNLEDEIHFKGGKFVTP
jgi:hypothetical protein